MPPRPARADEQRDSVSTIVSTIVVIGVWRVVCGVWRVVCGVWRLACGGTAPTGVWLGRSGLWLPGTSPVHRSTGPPASRYTDY